jgi:hypothetical protein
LNPVPYQWRHHAVTSLPGSGGDTFLPGGVWLSSSPDVRHRAMPRFGRAVMLAVDVPDDIAERYVAADFPMGWREFCIPAEIINAMPVKALVSIP